MARRYTRLRNEAGVRVVGAVRPEAVGRQLWLVRVRCPSLYAAGGSSELAHTVTAVMDLRIEMMRARLATAHEYVTRRV
ncbi:hypothetical protein [Streptomyces malaysiensis]|uniref:hypothetical protein n=1 Tax=Streptomyces malaysiensis TaxID=92644 RepID=UPI00114CF375|nr:hypothetical protein [Streptomyces sp. SPMA113]MCC4317283.1 hypothetical protein [Streptomyces malaysiensis]